VISEQTRYYYPMKRTLPILLTALLVVTSCATAGGSRERPAPAPAPTTEGPAEGTVTHIETTDTGDQILTVLRDDNAQFYITVPARLAGTLRLQLNDRVRSEEVTAVSPGERLRVQRLSVQRGQ
jgi:hypothetical protein